MRGRRVRGGASARIALAAALVLAVWPPVVAPAAAQEPTVVYLVRHAEAQGTSADRPLSDAGRRRVEALTDLLHAVSLDAVHTTDYARTRGTAEGPARSHALGARAYDPSRLGDLAALIRGEGGVHLVVGHSNTTPEMVAALGGEPGPPMPETEFDRLYVLVIEGDRVRTRVVRYLTDPPGASLARGAPGTTPSRRRSSGRPARRS